jgi:hypothetical protein
MDAHLDLFERMPAGRDYLLGDFSARGRPRTTSAFHRVLDEHQSLGPRRPALARWIARVDALPRAI